MQTFYHWPVGCWVYLVMLWHPIFKCNVLYIFSHALLWHRYGSVLHDAIDCPKLPMGGRSSSTRRVEGRRHCGGTWSRTPRSLHQAVYTGDRQALAEITNRHQAPCKRGREDGPLPLYRAMRLRDEKAVHILLEQETTNINTLFIRELPLDHQGLSRAKVPNLKWKWSVIHEACR